MRFLTVALALSGAGFVATACAHEWDDYDPRLGGGGSDVGSSTAGDVTSGATTSDASGSNTSGPGSTSGQSSGGDGGSGGSGAGPSVSSGGGSTSESSSTGTPTETLEIVAVEADCVDPTDPDPDTCDGAAATNAISVDDDADFPDDSWIGYLRFSPGGELAGKTVDSVKLRMHVSPEKRSDSDDSGVIWESEPFDRDALYFSAPDIVSGAPIGASVGPVTLGQEVTFDIVGLTVAADTPVYLAVTTSLMDGVDYLDERSGTPPTLIVTYH